VILSLAVMALVLAGGYAAMTGVNLLIYRPPPPPPAAAAEPYVSVLIPARNEAANIGPALALVQASRGVNLDVVVLDDGSDDGTACIVAELAAADPRLRLVRGAALPEGWNGKQRACWLLAQQARAPLLVFVDADVRLAPDAIARIAHLMDAQDLALASGFPRQITETWGETLLVPQILVLLLGYLPLPLARMISNPALAAGCGQLIAVRAEDYRAAGGHQQIRASRHDGLALPRAVRASGGRTDLFDATPLASCRMYASWRETWAGFGKNATEGMARPLALPVWTILLLGGHVLPFVAAGLAWWAGEPRALGLALAAVAVLMAARLMLALQMRQGLAAVLVHPVGVLLALAVQWAALVRASRGQPVAWRGRSYSP
jgi:hypothetical protein